VETGTILGLTTALVSKTLGPSGRGRLRSKRVSGEAMMRRVGIRRDAGAAITEEEAARYAVTDSMQCLPKWDTELKIWEVFRLLLPSS
jgi:hypothetical protein